MPKLTKGKAKVLSPDEFKHLLSTVANSKRDTLLILMSYGLGLRAKELAGLLIKDVLAENGDIIETVHLTKTKNNKPRYIYLADKRIIDALQAYINERKTDSPFSLTQHLFASYGCGFSNRTLQKYFEKLYKKAGLKGASSHSGRRTFATQLIESGADIKAVSTLMGHATITMTAQYVNDNPARLKRIIASALY
jgi:integrase/recombinase XerD